MRPEHYEEQINWVTEQVTTTQHQTGTWSRVTLRKVTVLSITVWQVHNLFHSFDGVESECHWEFTDRGDAMVKYREVR